jgi:hypothetical protein
MARLPLTVYLARAELIRLDARARTAGLARSAWAGDAIRAALGDMATREGILHEHLLHLHVSSDELIAAHPDSENIRLRVAARCAQAPLAADERN